MILSEQVRQTAIDAGKAMLAERPNRGRDLERENGAFRALIDQFARDPKKLLEKLCEEVVDLLDAGSAGVSLLQLRPEDDGIFYWPAIVGQWKGFVGGHMPRNASPCGVVCDSGGALLFQNPEIIFTAAAGISPVMEDLLVAPFFIDGAPAGTVWAIHHDRTKKFDQEDARLLQKLSQFASAAHQAQLNEARTVATNAARVASEAELRFALKAGRLGAWKLDLATGALVTSPTCRTNFGRDPEAPFSYTDLRGAILPDDQERMDAAVEFSIATHADYDIEYRIVTGAGEVRWVQIRGQPEYDANGAAVAMNGVSLDVTAVKESEVALRRAETRLRELNEMLEQRLADVLEERKVYADIIESSNSAVTALDRDYRILAINRSNMDAFEQVFGNRPKPGDDFLSLFEDAPELKSQQIAIWSRALSGETFEVLEEFGDARIERRSYEVRFSPLLNSKGERIGASSTSNGCGAKRP
jgi:PAS domain-containing protein